MLKYGNILLFDYVKLELITCNNVLCGHISLFFGSFAVPDDWCAPLGSEIVPNKDNECPSVRLRKLYIPLWHVPVVKQEVCISL